MDPDTLLPGGAAHGPVLSQGGDTHNKGMPGDIAVAGPLSTLLSGPGLPYPSDRSIARAWASERLPLPAAGQVCLIRFTAEKATPSSVFPASECGCCSVATTLITNTRLFHYITQFRYINVINRFHFSAK